MGSGTTYGLRSSTQGWMHCAGLDLVGGHRAGMPGGTQHPNPDLAHGPGHSTQGQSTGPLGVWNWQQTQEQN